ncbi:MAG: ATP-grasp fold amidoligase family protein [Actinomycetota bacterium]
MFFAGVGILGPNFAYWKLRRKYRNPSTYSEKLFHKLAFDRDPHLTMLVDRIGVRDYVRETIGEEFLTKSFLETYDVDSIDWAGLPHEYVCKVSHGCGGMIFVSEQISRDLHLPNIDLVKPWQRLQVHPDNADTKRINEILKYWLTLDYSWDKRRMIPEWAYRDVKRGVIFEEFIHSSTDRYPIDYKFFVVGGDVQLISAAEGRIENELRSTIYKGHWEPSKIRFKSQSQELREADPPLVPPAQAEEMCQIAIKLAEITDSARVDLYLSGDRVIFGEVTIYPSGGHSPFVDERDNIELGAMWPQVMRYEG